MSKTWSVLNRIHCDKQVNLKNIRAVIGKIRTHEFNDRHISDAEWYALKNFLNDAKKVRADGKLAFDFESNDELLKDKRFVYLMDLFFRLGLNIVITRQDRVKGKQLNSIQSSI